eukprot:CAMPEP_0170419956 /NCGR_PEP_ID=MMETSP0117_2-20130122/35081_1 /TAXON_ID=400756 /ORGANISM="Durinskia baltica, Strain CSIRO CS-38" /LENGTH=190 /DNA_ID=CAMNT_0010678353 /DNA_START=202 /DNA_END=773 /DNA_ORIENTATION=+
MRACATNPEVEQLVFAEVVRRDEGDAVFDRLANETQIRREEDLLLVRVRVQLLVYAPGAYEDRVPLCQKSVDDAAVRDSGVDQPQNFTEDGQVEACTGDSGEVAVGHRVAVAWQLTVEQEGRDGVEAVGVPTSETLAPMHLLHVSGALATSLFAVKPMRRAPANNAAPASIATRPLPHFAWRRATLRMYF